MKRTLHTLGLATMLAGTLAPAPPASAAFVSLPSNGAQVNDDAANSIDPKQDAGLVDVAGGTVVAGNVQVPWATFEQKLGDSQQIFVRAFKNGAWVTQGSPASLNIDPRVEAGAPCTGFKPSAANNVNGFCFQQVGLERLDSGQSTPRDATVDPTLNIDPTRAGVEPDIAFTGQDDKVVWTVWYEEGPTAVPGLRSNEMVFAAKAVANAAADGGFQWVAVGSGTEGQTNVLDRSGAHHFGPCAESDESEDACSLNADNFADAENPRVAAGTLTPGQPTVPWVVWAGAHGGGRHTIFISRLVGGDHFELFKPGQPISNRANDARRPDITFAGNVPYLPWPGEA